MKSTTKAKGDRDAMASLHGSATAAPLLNLAPAPTKNGYLEDDASSQSLMPYTCQTCTRRKVKCDKSIPSCSTCRKAKLECTYQAPAPRRKKRRLSDDVNDKLRRYEQILQNNGLLENGREKSSPTSPSSIQATQPSVSIRVNEPETARVGKLLTRSGKMRYIDSNLWRTIGDDEMDQFSEEDEREPEPNAHTIQYMSDPFTGSLTGGPANLLDFHPEYRVAKRLWTIYLTNVDPLCRVLHGPSTGPILDEAARDPSNISKTTECLAFAVYHFAVVSCTNAECLEVMGEAKVPVLAKLRHAVCQSLVNAGLLRSSEMIILQAYVLYLLSVRGHYDPHTFWILSGVAWRIGQRMGLHRDGEVLGLPPFDIQMRRRLFWQLLPMDGIAAQISGTGIAAAPDSWDTKPPLNLNESQIWPGMTHQPEEQEGATDMIFCRARTEIGSFHNRTAVQMRDRGKDPAAEAKQLEEKILQMEDMLERKFVRYCDVVDPLHFLTISLCRGAMVVIRLRLKITESKHSPVSEANLREVHRLSMKVVDYDSTVFTNPRLRGYMWHMGALFLHSAVACALTSLRTSMFLTPEELRAAWDKLGLLMANHPEILDQKRALDIAIGRLMLKAWDSSAHVAGLVVEPGYITALREARSGHKSRKGHVTAVQSADTITDGTFTESTSPDSFGVLTGLPNEDLNFNPNDYSSMDWMYWDQLMQDFQQGKPFNVS